MNADCSCVRHDSSALIDNDQLEVQAGSIMKKLCVFRPLRVAKNANSEETRTHE
jgi:hypothetical protein